MKRTRRNAFTPIEVLIVVVVMAVLAATIIPQFFQSTRDAKDSSLKFNLHSLRSQIELYKQHHSGNYPTLDAATNDLPQLTNPTNAQGTVGVAGPGFPFGPYVDTALPVNPFDNSNKVTAVAQAGVEPTGVVGTLGGWQFDASNGAVWPNNPEYYETP